MRVDRLKTAMAVFFRADYAVTILGMMAYSNLSPYCFLRIACAVRRCFFALAMLPTASPPIRNTARVATHPD